MSAAVHAEDHQGGDDAPAAVTCAFAGRDRYDSYCEGTCGTRLQHNFNVMAVLIEKLTQPAPNYAPKTLGDDGNRIT